MTQLTGRVVHRGHPGWDESRVGFNARPDYDAAEPLAVVFCQDAHDVSNAVRWAREKGVPLSVRSGRHNYEGYSSRVRGGVVVDTSELQQARYDHVSGVATLGAGLDMLSLSEKLWQCGVTVPVSTGAGVGLAGLVLGGGFGLNSRLFGLTCDSLLEVEIVDAQGAILRADAHRNEDLFWACRGGGGGSFGIATSFAFQAHPVSTAATFRVSWAWPHFEAVVDAWQRWAPAVDDAVSSLLSLTATRQVVLMGQFTAPPHEVEGVHDLLRPLLQAAPSEALAVQALPHIEAARAFFGLGAGGMGQVAHGRGVRQIFKSTSALAYEPFDSSAIATLRGFLEDVPPLSQPPSQPSMVQLLGGGGAASRVAHDATPICHRKARFLVQYDGYWNAPEDGPATVDWVRRMRAAMAPWTRGAYANYSDEDIEDWAEQYYGENLPRLVEIKRRRDPENVFRFAQSIPLSLPARH